MSETVLSQLCSICHAEPHKYKCPGCGARTCSLACTKKHKVRTECTGRRNPTDYIPKEKLCTPAGIDHDYNFISAIDRAKQRAERDIVEELQLLKEEELHPKNEDAAFRKVWAGDQLRYEVVDPRDRPRRGPRGVRGPPPTTTFDKHVRRRIKALDIDVRSMPKGMARQKENGTSYNRRTKCINWQVEWLLYGFSEFDQTQQPTRIIHKALDSKPLNKALATSFDWQLGQLDRVSREQPKDRNGEEDGEQFICREGQEDDERQQQPQQQIKSSAAKRIYQTKKRWEQTNPAQDPETGTWPASCYILQYSLTSEWNQWSVDGRASVPATEDEKAADFAKWRFYLHQTGVPAPGGRKPLIPLASVETLADALTGRGVVEFPTIYAFPPSMASLPEGFVEGPVERRTKRKIEVSDSDDDDDDLDGDGGHRAKKARQTKREDGEGGYTERRQPEQPQRGNRQQNNQRGGRGGRGGRGSRGGRGGGAQRGAGPDVRDNPPAGMSDVDVKMKNESEEEGEIMSDAEPMDLLREDERRESRHKGEANDYKYGVQDPMSFSKGEAGALSQPKGVGLVDYDSSGND